MFSRWYSVAVILFWLATTGWLVKEKILPPLLVGEPPSYRTILAAENSTEPIAWEIHFNGKRLGGTVTRTLRMPDGISQFKTKVLLKELPLSELTPAWISTSSSRSWMETARMAKRSSRFSRKRRSTSVH